MWKWIGRIAGSVLAVLMLLAALSALDNRRLPTRSETTDRLSEAEKARLAEVLHLRQSLGDTVWEGWGQSDIPVIVYNEAFAFLVGYPDPPPGWIRVPQNELQGGPWEVVPGEAFLGQPYYRQPLPDPEATPQSFTALVGTRWVATLQTKEYAEIAFYRGFGEQLPPPLQPVFPYRLFWSFLGGDTEVYLGALAHESFHAFQGQRAPERLDAAETAARLEDRYPWDDPEFAAAWQAELDALAAAVEAGSDAEAARLALQFLELRTERRRASELDPDLADYERLREWLEGQAKYAELEILRQAALSPDYAPVLEDDPDFEAYAGSLRYWSQQLDEVRRTGGREGEGRFYYSGFAQAALLDRLLPGWKARALDPGVWLEDLLAEAVQAGDIIQSSCAAPASCAAHRSSSSPLRWPPSPATPLSSPDRTPVPAAA